VAEPPRRGLVATVLAPLGCVLSAIGTLAMLVVWPIYCLGAVALHRLGLFPARRSATWEGKRRVAFHWMGPAPHVTRSVRAAAAALVDLATEAAGAEALERLQLENPGSGASLRPERLQPIRSDFADALAGQLEGGSIEQGRLWVNGSISFEALSADLRSRMNGHVDCELPFDLDDATFDRIATRHGFTPPAGGGEPS